MKFLGYDFPDINLPVNLTYQPPGWTDSLTFQINRRAAQVGAQIATTPGSRIRPLLFEPLAVGNLPRLNCSGVVDSLVAHPKALAATDKGDATSLPEIWSQRPQVLDDHSMGGVMCAGFMIATFSYEEDQPPGSPKPTLFRHQDSAVATAINLAKKKVDNIKVTMVHDNSPKPTMNLDQAHTEMNLAKQLDAFLTLLETHAATGKRQASAISFVKDFKLKNLVVAASIRWDHRQNNVVSACNACTGVMDEVENTWGPKLKSITLTPSKAA